MIFPPLIPKDIAIGLNTLRVMNCLTLFPCQTLSLSIKFLPHKVTHKLQKMM